MGIPINEHSKLPDVVLYDKKRKWLFLIEAVTSHGPVSPKRIVELEKMLKDCKVGKVYVSAFPDFKEFKKHTANIADCLKTYQYIYNSFAKNSIFSVKLFG